MKIPESVHYIFKSTLHCMVLLFFISAICCCNPFGRAKKSKLEKFLQRNPEFAATDSIAAQIKYKTDDVEKDTSFHLMHMKPIFFRSENVTVTHTYDSVKNETFLKVHQKGIDTVFNYTKVVHDFNNSPQSVNNQIADLKDFLMYLLIVFVLLLLLVCYLVYRHFSRKKIEVINIQPVTK